MRFCLALWIAGCSLDRAGIGPRPDGGPEVDAFVAGVDAYLPPGVDGGPAPPLDGGATCTPRCEGTVQVTCPGGSESRLDCASLPGFCDATGGMPTCVGLLCMPGSVACSGDATARVQCDGTGTMPASTHCDRGCDPATNDCRPEVACGETIAATMTEGAMSLDLCRTGDDANGSCANSDGEDVVVRLEVDRDGHYVIDERDQAGGHAVDTVVFVRTDCAAAGSELGCDDDGGGTFGGGALDSHLELDLVAGEYFVIVDSIDNQSGGSGTGCGTVDLTIARR